MASENPRDQDLHVPPREGEFHRIPGIGPGIEQRLHAAGIRTFEHLASLTPDEICAMLNGMVGMTPERIGNQDWPGKAGLLAKALREEKSPLEPDEPGERQHYASFMVELLQDEEQAVRRTRVVHVQAGSKDSWAGWDARRLLEFLHQQAGIGLGIQGLGIGGLGEKEEEGAMGQESLAAEITADAEMPPVRLEPPVLPEPPVRLEPPVVFEAQETPSTRPLGRGVRGSVGVLFAGVVDPQSDKTSQFLYTGSPMQLNLAVDMRKTGLPRGLPLICKLLVEARLVGSVERIRLAETSGEHLLQDEMQFTVPLQALPEGTYRILVAALLAPLGDPKPERDGMHVFTDGGIIHVFDEVAVV